MVESHGPGPPVYETYTVSTFGVEDRSNMIVFDLIVNRIKIKALLDTGASKNFVREAVLGKIPELKKDTVIHDGKAVAITLATGEVQVFDKKTVEIQHSIGMFTSTDEFTVLDIDTKFDVILGMPWCSRHEPLIDWQQRTLIQIGSVHVGNDSQCESSTDVAQSGHPVSKGDSDGPLATTPLSNAQRKKRVRFSLAPDDFASAVVADGNESSCKPRRRGTLRVKACDKASVLKRENDVNVHDGMNEEDTRSYRHEQCRNVSTTSNSRSERYKDESVVASAPLQSHVIAESNDMKQDTPAVCLDEQNVQETRFASDTTDHSVDIESQTISVMVWADNN